MKLASIPTKIANLWANAAGTGYIRTIPTASQQQTANPGAASFTDGFPPACFLPIGSGGTPPAGQDFNGILQQLSAWSQWTAASGLTQWDSTFSAAIGGYPLYATVTSNTTQGRVWVSVVDGNTTNPDQSGQTAWLPLMLASDVLALIAANAPQIVAGNPTLYFSGSGSDSTGTGTTAAPFATPQTAINYAVTRFVTQGKTITIQAAAAGTYPMPTSIPAAAGALVVAGLPGNPTAVTLSGAGASGAPGICTVGGTNVTFSGLQVQNTTANLSALVATAGGLIQVSNVNITCSQSNTGSLLAAFAGGAIQIVGNMTFGSSAGSAINSQGGSVSVNSGVTLNMASGNAYSNATVISSNCGEVIFNANSAFSGSATGKRYSATLNGVINTFGGGANFIPGSTAGTVDSQGGQYA